MERCPCCNARLGGLSICTRCQTDLSAVISSAQAADYWLQQAIQSWALQDTEQSVKALVCMLRLKKSKLGLLFRDFIISHQAKKILALLSQQQLSAAKHQLYLVRWLIPQSQLLQQIQAFLDYLMEQNNPCQYTDS
jgi:hypothetical protein